MSELTEIIDVLYEGKADYHQQLMAAELLQGQATILRGLLNDQNRQHSIQHKRPPQQLQKQSRSRTPIESARVWARSFKKASEDAGVTSKEVHDCTTHSDKSAY